MIARYWAIASPFDLRRRERILLKLKRSEYLRMRKRIIRLDKTNKKSKKIKNYPVLNRKNKDKTKVKMSYTIYGVYKELKIEEIAPINLERLLRRSK